MGGSFPVLAARPLKDRVALVWKTLVHLAFCLPLAASFFSPCLAASSIRSLAAPSITLLLLLLHSWEPPSHSLSLPWHPPALRPFAPSGSPGGGIHPLRAPPSCPLSLPPQQPFQVPMATSSSLIPRPCLASIHAQEATPLPCHVTRAPGAFPTKAFPAASGWVRGSRS